MHCRLQSPPPGPRKQRGRRRAEARVAATVPGGANGSFDRLRFVRGVEARAKNRGAIAGVLSKGAKLPVHSWQFAKLLNVFHMFVSLFPFAEESTVHIRHPPDGILSVVDKRRTHRPGLRPSCTASFSVPCWPSPRPHALRNRWRPSARSVRSARRSASGRPANAANGNTGRSRRRARPRRATTRRSTRSAPFSGHG